MRCYIKISYNSFNVGEDLLKNQSYLQDQLRVFELYLSITENTLFIPYIFIYIFQVLLQIMI